MTDIVHKEPVVKGSCNTDLCGAACCKIRVYDPGNVTYTTRWCEHFVEETKKCGIHETRPDRCRNYPTVKTFSRGFLKPGCSYYLEEDLIEHINVE